MAINHITFHLLISVNMILDSYLIFSKINDLELCDPDSEDVAVASKHRSAEA